MPKAPSRRAGGGQALANERTVNDILGCDTPGGGAIQDGERELASVRQSEVSGKPKAAKAANISRFSRWRS
ncbi:MAG TPA: hypothetical protein VE988_19540 [Gemmataceae bacterium]|nr:hypothetical protein [Gemmataceae bacterium]